MTLSFMLLSKPPNIGVIISFIESLFSTPTMMLWNIWAHNIRCLHAMHRGLRIYNSLCSSSNIRLAPPTVLQMLSVEDIPFSPPYIPQFLVSFLLLIYMRPTPSLGKCLRIQLQVFPLLILFVMASCSAIIGSAYQIAACALNSSRNCIKKDTLVGIALYTCCRLLTSGRLWDETSNVLSSDVSSARNLKGTPLMQVYTCPCQFWHSRGQTLVWILSLVYRIHREASILYL